MPRLVGSWLLPAGTVSLVGSRGLAASSDESIIFFFLFKSHPLSCDIGTEKCVVFLFFYFCNLCSFNAEEGKIDLGRQRQSYRWVSPQPQIPAAGWVAWQLPSELRNLSSARFSPSLPTHSIQIYCIHQDRTHQIPWKQNTLSCTNTGLLPRHHALRQKGRAVAVEGP